VPPIAPSCCTYNIETRRWGQCGPIAGEPIIMPRLSPYVQWFEEEDDAAQGGARRQRAAWLIRDLPEEGGEPRRQVLAYLGPRPAVTAALREEVAALYPDVDVDWDAVRHAISSESGVTNVAALSDDELALRLIDLARERGLDAMDLSLRLGYAQRQVLPELLGLLADAASVGRFERTSGSVFDYMAERHPEYAYLLYKARLLFQGEESLLADLIAAEPRGFDDAAWRARRRFWQLRLDAYRRSRRAPT